MTQASPPLTPLRAALFVLAAPWYLLWGLGRLAWSVARAGRGIRQLHARASDEAVCAAGHKNTLLGRWQCRCGFEYAGHAFSPCASCGEEAGWIRCDQCGLGLRNPEIAT